MEKSELLKKLKKKKTNCKKRIHEYYILVSGGLAGSIYGSYALDTFVLTAGIGLAILGGIGIYSTYQENKETSQRISELEKKLE